MSAMVSNMAPKAQNPHRLSEPEWLLSLRAKADAAFQVGGLPGKTDENWKYMRFGTALTQPVAQHVVDAALGDLPPVEADRMAFVDGIYAPSLSQVSDLPDGVLLLPLTEALERPEVRAALEAAMAQADGVTHLNLSLWQDGTVLFVPRGMAMTRPVHLWHGGAQDVTAHLVHLVLLEAGASAMVMEQYGAEGRGTTQPLVLVRLGEAAELTHVTVQTEGMGQSHIAEQQVALGTGAQYRHFQWSLGASVHRRTVKTRHAGAQTKARFFGAYLARDGQYTDHTMPILHDHAGAASEQRYKGVLADQAVGVFYGKIIVPEHATQTEAHQQSRALLLSDRAQAVNRPELEILTDQVQCSHGAAVGQLDRQALYYLQARGLTQAEARRLLVEAFVAELLEPLENEPLSEWLRAMVHRWVEDVTDERRS